MHFILVSLLCLYVEQTYIANTLVAYIYVCVCVNKHIHFLLFLLCRGGLPYINITQLATYNYFLKYYYDDDQTNLLAEGYFPNQQQVRPYLYVMYVIVLLSCLCM